VSEDRFAELLGPYVLGELSAEEERELERHLAGCSECQDELARARQIHVLLRELAAGGPPPELKARVLGRARGEMPARSRGGWRLWVPAAAALLLAAILGMWLLQAIVEDSSGEVALTATALAPGASGDLRGEKIGQNLQIELEVQELPRLSKDEYYEMWYAREDGGRISCGTFRAQPEGKTTVTLTAPVSAVSYPIIEVTREPDDGDPGSSGEKVLVGNLRSL
jgi:anti-sigma-K factor RskA